jgi:hypothetical protein
MTAPILPSFILELFTNEVQKIVHKEIAKVCELYDLNIDEVEAKLGRVELHCTETPGFRIMKKRESIAPKEVRCIARMVHDLDVKQCSKKRGSNSCFCGKHNKSNLKYGTINDPLPDELRPEVMSQKKLNKIY